MNKDDLDFIIDCHIENWKRNNNYNVNLFGLAADEKEYIMTNFKERIKLLSTAKKITK
jgi:hypothetical protein